MNGKIALAIFAAAVICVSAMAQENTADDWYKKGLDLGRNGSYEEAVLAYNRAIELDSTSSEAWKGKGDSLKALGRQAEADVAYAKAKELGYQG